MDLTQSAAQNPIDLINHLLMFLGEIKRLRICFYSNGVIKLEKLKKNKYIFMFYTFILNKCQAVEYEIIPCKTLSIFVDMIKHSFY